MEKRTATLTVIDTLYRRACSGDDSAAFERALAQFVGCRPFMNGEIDSLRDAIKTYLSVLWSEERERLANTVWDKKEQTAWLNTQDVLDAKRYRFLRLYVEKHAPDRALVLKELFNRLAICSDRLNWDLYIDDAMERYQRVLPVLVVLDPLLPVDRIELRSPDGKTSVIVQVTKADGA